MKRTLALLLCLGLLLTGCTAGHTSPASSAGLTIEEHALARDGGGMSNVLAALIKQPEIREKRKQWRDLPRTDGIALTFTPEEQTRLLHHPVKVGDSAVYVRANQNWDVEVVANDRVLYTYTHPDAARMASPTYMVQGLNAWNGKWVLETVEAKVLVGGESLNDRLGHAQIFGFRMIAGKPFYFFTQDGKVRVSYDGKVLPQSYDKVPHYGCCDSTGYNPRGSERMVSFFGLRDGQWYHVDMGSYD